jgi:integrase
MNEQAITLWQEPDIDLLFAAWLDAKTGRTQSEKTKRAYNDTLRMFRLALWKVELALDSDPVAVSLVAQGWAGKAWRTGGEVKPSTFDLRLAIVSSWYRFAMKRAPRRFSLNPITLVERKPVQAYASAEALEPQGIEPMLAKINQDTFAGARDYALLLLALVTGRRVAELAGMRWKHIKRLLNGRLVVHFPRCKGGKQIDDLLPAIATRAMLFYLRKFYGDLEQMQDDDPIWVCLSHRDWGKPLTTRSMSRVCKQCLGTSKAHTTRHTFVRTMEDAGAKASTIAMRLVQDNPAIVGRYLARLRREDNQHEEGLVSLHGFTGNRTGES